MILSTPRKSNMKQILGRIFRLRGDQKIKRYIIDLVDNRTCLKSQYYSRKKSYNDLSDNVKSVKINWDECRDIDILIQSIAKLLA